MDNHFVFLDIETTGVSPDTDSIIEVGAVLACQGDIVDRFSSLVRFEGKLPLKISNLTGITEEMLTDAPGVEEVAPRLAEFIGEYPIVGHNISFDINFIRQKFGLSLKNPAIDTYELVQFLLPTAVSYRLDSLVNILGEKNGVSHRALDDAETACRLFNRCLEIISELNPEVLTEVYRLCEGQDFQTVSFIRDIVRETLKQFPAGQTKLPYAFLKNTDSDFSPLFGDSSLGNRNNRINLSKLSSVLEADGPFAKLKGYKFRAGQVDMLRTVIEGFTQNKHMVIEAGTGTGKSLAYLIPAVGWAVAQETKVVIATHTINLQEQLWNKEIPELRKTADFEFTAALVKGRTNYLCLRRWESKLKDNRGTQREELLFDLKILVWLTETLTGDRSEINIAPVQREFWNRISSDIDTCLGPVCKWFNGHCFVGKARKQAENADILVVNHSLLLADIKTDNHILPHYDYLIIDEAHHLEDSATEQLGWTLSFNSLKTSVIALNRGFGSGLGPGLLNVLKKVFNASCELFTPADGARFEQLVNEAFDKVKSIIEVTEALEEFLKTWSMARIAAGDDDTYATVRIRSEHRNDTSWHVLDSMIDNFITRTVSFINIIGKLGTLLEALPREQQKNHQVALRELEAVTAYFTEIQTQFRAFLEGQADYVYWVEVAQGNKPDLKLRSAPVSVSQLLSDSLFGVKKSVLLTSATITVDGSFEHFLERTGLSIESQEVITRLYDSPFSYEKQALLCVIRDLPEPAGSNGLFTEDVVPVIANMVKVLGGRTLILFNSHKMLREIYFKLQPVLEEVGISVLGHKIDGGRTRLINEFQQNNRTVLMGAGSFWEGIDLPGDMLKCVIIARLPFSPPTTPVVEARMEELMSKQRDAFYSYAVPEAVIKLKQGFGRLIRTEMDEGAVVVLDRRMVEKRYGRKFLNSLPLKTHFKGDSATVLQKIRDWLQGERTDVPGFNIIDSISDIEKFLHQTKREKNG